MPHTTQKWIQADNDTSVLPSCSTIAEEMCDHPDYARLVDIQATNMNLILLLVYQHQRNQKENQRRTHWNNLKRRT